MKRIVVLAFIFTLFWLIISTASGCKSGSESGGSRFDSNSNRIIEDQRLQGDYQGYVTF